MPPFQAKSNLKVPLPGIRTIDIPYCKGFVDGLKFFTALFLRHFAEDPVSLNQALMAVFHAEQNKKPPNHIEVHWSSQPQPWNSEFERIRRNYGRHIFGRQDFPEGGRPRTGDGEWT